MLINRIKDSANSWCKQGENRKVKIWREHGWGERTRQGGGKCRKQILVPFGIQGFLLSQRRLDLTQNSLQMELILESRIKRRATCR